MTANTTNTLPLLRHFDAESPLASAHGIAITAQEFLGAATMLSARLPRARHVINLCEDRYNFLLGFSAALIARQVTLMPSSRAVDAIAQLQSAFDGSYCLTDQTVADLIEPLSRVAFVSE